MTSSITEAQTHPGLISSMGDVKLGHKDATS